MRFGILGPLRVTDGDQNVALGPRRQRQLLAVLIANAGRVVPLDRLIDELWGITPPAAATASIQAYVSNLRRALEPRRGARARASVLVTEPPGYVLRVEPDQVDALRFERLVARAGELLTAGSYTETAIAVDEALREWRGQPLSDFTHDAFAERDIQRLLDLYAECQEQDATAKLALGDASATLASTLEQLVADHPLRERARGLLMLAYYRTGRQVDALKVYDDFRDRLLDELGLDPGPELRAIHLQVLNQDAALATQQPVADAARQIVLVASPASSRTASTPPARSSQDDFVGRDEMLDRLTALMHENVDGQARFALIGGEAGIGKTRLLEHFAARMSAAGVTVAWGRAHDDAGLPPLWPWAQILRRVCGGPDEIAVRDRRALAAVLPELGDTEDLSGDPESARYRMFDAVRAAITAEGSSRPLLLVLDDLQWADPSSARLLGFLATERLAGPLLVVALFHEPSNAAPGTFGGVIADMSRLPHVERLALTGLSRDDLRELIEVRRDIGAPDAARLADTLHARTNGNAFFVTELLRLLDSENRQRPVAELVATEVPGVVVDVIRRRVQRLPDDAQAALSLAAVVGDEFSLDVLDLTSDLDADAVFTAAEAALMTGMVVEIGNRRYRFAHGLVADTLYHDLSATRRARLHGRVATAIEQLAGGDGAQRAPDDVVTQLALHYRLADNAPKLLLYAEQAAAISERTFAFDETVTHLEIVVDHLPDDADPARRIGLLVRLARALRMVGQVVRSCEVHELAADLASATADPDVIAMAATAFSEVNMWQVRRYGEVDERIVHLLERMLSALPSGDSSVRAHLLMGLASSLYYRAEERDRALRALREARAIAARVGDPATEVLAISELFVFLDPEPDPTELLALVDEALELWQRISTTMPHRELFELNSCMLRVPRVRLSVGDADNLSLALDDAEELGTRWHDRVFTVFVRWARVTESFLNGRYEEAEQYALSAFELHGRLGIWGAAETAAVHLVNIWRQQGRLQEMATVVEPLLQQGEFPRLNKLLAFFALDRGDLDAVARYLGPDPVPASRDFTWLCELCITAVEASAVQHPCCETLYAQLLPFAGRVATMDATFACLGSVSYYLGLLAASLGDTDGARQHLRDGLATNERIGAVPWIERTRSALDALEA